MAAERSHVRVPDTFIGKLPETRLAVEETDCHAEGRGELAGIAIGWPVLFSERLPQAMNGPLTYLASDGNDVRRP